MEELYKEHILELYRNPINKRTISNPTIVQRGYNPHCGDDITIQIVLENQIIKDIAFVGTGCAISQASISLLTEQFAGKTITEALAFTEEDCIATLAIPISKNREKCALLGLKTIHYMMRTYVA